MEAHRSNEATRLHSAPSERDARPGFFGSRALGGLALAALLAGCSAEANAPSDPQSELTPGGSESVRAVEQPVWGTPVNMRGAICVRKTPDAYCCSGSILNNQMIMTAAHCLDGNFNGPRNVSIEYQGPSGTRSWAFDAGEMFFYHYPNWDTDPRVEWDVAVGVLGAPNTLNLPSKDFVTIYQGGLDGKQAYQLGYGASLGAAPDIQRKAQIKTTWVGSQHVKWSMADAAGTALCSGDSGGPGMRNSGYSDSLGPYWDAQALVAVMVNNSAPEGTAVCGDSGRSSRLVNKVDWIRSIVEFWTPWTCTSFTNPKGEPAAWCWNVR